VCNFTVRGGLLCAAIMSASCNAARRTSCNALWPHMWGHNLSHIVRSAPPRSMRHVFRRCHSAHYFKKCINSPRNNACRMSIFFGQEPFKPSPSSLSFACIHDFLPPDFDYTHLDALERAANQFYAAEIEGWEDILDGQEMEIEFQQVLTREENALLFVVLDKFAQHMQLTLVEKNVLFRKNWGAAQSGEEHQDETLNERNLIVGLTANGGHTEFGEQTCTMAHKGSATYFHPNAYHNSPALPKGGRAVLLVYFKTGKNGKRLRLREDTTLAEAEVSLAVLFRP